MGKLVFMLWVLLWPLCFTIMVKLDPPSDKNSAFAGGFFFVVWAIIAYLLW
jgi:hypothetical protein